MIRVALCDDDAVFLDKLYRAVKEWFQKNRPEQKAEIEVFHDGKALLDSTEKSFDIFFLDIEMPTISGLETAKQIRERKANAILIFLTAHEEFAMEGYRISAIRYLWKLELEKYLPEALEAALREAAKIKRGSLSVSYYGNTTVIPFEEILYVQHLLRSSQIHTLSSGVIKDNRGLKELYSLLDEGQFVYVDRGTFVNLDYVFQIAGNAVVLKNKEELPASRGMLPKVKLAINRLWGEN